MVFLDCKKKGTGNKERYLTMSPQETINVFVSHCGDDAAYLDSLNTMLKNIGYDVRDSSLDERDPNNASNPEYIKSLIRPKIDWAGKIIVLIGKDTYTREWVNWEIDYAHKTGDKRIIGIYVPGGTNSDLPENFKLFGDTLIPWNSAKLRNAIESENIYLNPDGNPSEGIFNKNTNIC